MAQDKIYTKGLQIEAGMKFTEKTLKEAKNEIIRFAKDMSDEVSMQIKANADKKQINETIRQGFGEINRVFSSYNLPTFEVKDFLDLANPFEKIGQVAAEKFASGFSVGGGAFNSITETVEKIYNLIEKQTNESADKVKNKYSKTLNELQEAGERYLKKGKSVNEALKGKNVSIVKDDNVDVEKKIKAKKDLIGYYTASKENNGTWEEKYAADVEFVKFYKSLSRAFSEKNESIERLFGNDKDLLKNIQTTYDRLLDSFDEKIDMLKNVQEYNPENPAMFKHGNVDGAWAKESTLQEVKKILKEGIKVGGDGGGGSGNAGSGSSGQSSEENNKQTKNYDLYTQEESLSKAKELLELEDEIAKARLEKLQGINRKENTESELISKYGHLKSEFTRHVVGSFDSLREELRKKLIESGEYTPSEIKNPYAKKYNIYRGFGIDPDTNEEPKTRAEYLKKYGGEYYATDRKTAESYADSLKDAGVISGTADVKNPIVINAHGKTFTSYKNMTIGEGENQKPIVDVIPGLAENLEKIKRNKGESKEKQIKDTQLLINQWAKSQGADALIVDNVFDSKEADTKTSKPTSTIAILDDRIVKIDEILRGVEDENGETKYEQGQLPSWYDMTGIDMSGIEETIAITTSKIQELNSALDALVNTIKGMGPEDSKLQSLNQEKEDLEKQKQELIELKSKMTGEKVNSSVDRSFGSKTKINTDVQASKDDVIYGSLYKSEQDLFRLAKQYNNEWQAGLKIFREHAFAISNGVVKQLTTGDISSGKWPSQSSTADTLGHTHPQGSTYSEEDIATMRNTLKKNSNYNRDILITQDQVMQITGLQSLQGLSQEIQDEFFDGIKDIANSVSSIDGLSSSAVGKVKNIAIKAFIDKFTKANGIQNNITTTLGTIEENGNVTEDAISNEELKEVYSFVDSLIKYNKKQIQYSTRKNKFDKFKKTGLFTKLSQIKDPTMTMTGTNIAEDSLIQRVLDQKTSELPKIYDLIERQITDVFSKTEDVDSLPEYLKQLNSFFKNNTGLDKSNILAKDIIENLKTFYGRGWTTGIDDRENYVAVAKKYGVDLGTGSSSNGFRSDVGDISNDSESRISDIEQRINELRADLNTDTLIDWNSIIEKVEHIKTLMSTVDESIYGDNFKYLQSTIDKISETTSGLQDTYSKISNLNPEFSNVPNLNMIPELLGDCQYVIDSMHNGTDLTLRSDVADSSNDLSEIDQITSKIEEIDRLIAEKNAQILSAMNIDFKPTVDAINAAITEIIDAAKKSIPLYDGIAEELNKTYEKLKELSNIGLNVTPKEQTTNPNPEQKAEPKPNNSSTKVLEYEKDIRVILDLIEAVSGFDKKALDIITGKVNGTFKKSKYINNDDHLFNGHTSSVSLTSVLEAYLVSAKNQDENEKELFDRLAAYVYAIDNESSAKEVFGEDNAPLLKKIYERITEANLAAEAPKKIYDLSQQLLGSIRQKYVGKPYTVTEHASNVIAKAKAGDVEGALDYLREKFGVEKQENNQQDQTPNTTTPSSETQQNDNPQVSETDVSALTQVLTKALESGAVNIDSEKLKEINGLLIPIAEGLAKLKESIKPEEFESALATLFQKINSVDFSNNTADLRKKAQSMTLNDFLNDESLSFLKKSNGLKTEEEQEDYWRKSKYSKDVTFFPISQTDAQAIIKKKIPENLINMWYWGDSLSKDIKKNDKFAGSDINSKKELEALILGDDELRNAAMNSMWYSYNMYHSKDKKGFFDFINTPTTVYRGAKDTDRDNNLPSFSFDEKEARVWSENIVSQLIKPRDTVGFVGPDNVQREQEVWVRDQKAYELDPSAITQEFEQALNNLIQIINDSANKISVSSNGNPDEMNPKSRQTEPDLKTAEDSVEKFNSFLEQFSDYSAKSEEDILAGIELFKSLYEKIELFNSYANNNLTVLKPNKTGVKKLIQMSHNEEREDPDFVSFHSINNNEPQTIKDNATNVGSNKSNEIDDLLDSIADRLTKLQTVINSDKLKEINTLLVSLADNLTKLQAAIKPEEFESAINGLIKKINGFETTSTSDDKTAEQNDSSNLKNERQLLPSYDNFKRTDTPTDEQKIEMQKLISEYIQIAKLLQNEDAIDKDIVSSLKERANAILDILDETRMPDGELFGQLRYYDVSDDSKSKFLKARLGAFGGGVRYSNVDTNLINNESRQKAITLIYEQIEAEKRLEEEEKAEKQREIDEFVNKYKDASNEAKRLVQEIVALNRELKRLEGLDGIKSSADFDTAFSLRTEKRAQLKNTDLDMCMSMPNFKSGNKLNVSDEALDNIIEELLYRKENTNAVENENNVIDDKEKQITKEDLKSILESIFSNVINNYQALAKDESVKNVITEVKNNEKAISNQKNDWAKDVTLKGTIAKILNGINTNTQNIRTVISTDNQLKTMHATIGRIAKAIESVNKKIPAKLYGGSPKQPTGSKDIAMWKKQQQASLNKWYSSLFADGKLTPEIDQKWTDLVTSLGNVSSGSGITDWNKQLRLAKNEIEEIVGYQKIDNKDKKTQLELIDNLTDKYEKAAITAARAKGPEETQFYSDQAVYYLNQRQTAIEQYERTTGETIDLLQRQLDLEQQIAGIKSKKTDESNAKKEKEEKKAVAELIVLYEKLGKLRADITYAKKNNISHTQEDADFQNILKQIQQKRPGLGSYHDQFSNAAQQAYQHQMLGKQDNNVDKKNKEKDKEERKKEEEIKRQKEEIKRQEDAAWTAYRKEEELESKKREEIRKTYEIREESTEKEVSAIEEACNKEIEWYDKLEERNKEESLKKEKESVKELVALHEKLGKLKKEQEYAVQNGITHKYVDYRIDKTNKDIKEREPDISNKYKYENDFQKAEQAGMDAWEEQHRTSSKKTTSDIDFNLLKDTRESALDLYEQKLKSTGKITSEIQSKIDSLRTKFNNVIDTHSLQTWNKEFEKMRNEIGQITLQNNENTFDDLINKTEEYYQLKLMSEKAKGPKEKAFYEQETAKALKDQEKIEKDLIITEEQRKELNIIREESERKINALKEHKKDSDEAKFVKDLISLYDKLGQLEANIEDAKKHGKNYNGFQKEAESVNRKIEEKKLNNGEYFSKHEAQFDEAKNESKEIRESYLSQKAADSAKSKAGVKKDANARLKPIYSLMGQLQAKLEVALEDEKIAIQTRIENWERYAEQIEKGKDIDKDMLLLVKSDAEIKEREKLKRQKDNQEITDAKNRDKMKKRETEKSAGLGKVQSILDKSYILDTKLNSLRENGVNVDQSQAIIDYTKSLKKLNEEYKILKNQKDLITPEQAQRLNELRLTANEDIKKVEKLVSEYRDPIALQNNFVTGDPSTYKEQLESIAMALTEGSATIGDFNEKTNTLSISVRKSDREIENIDLSVQGLDNSVTKINKSIKPTETFLDGIKRKTKEITQYLAGALSVNRLIGEVKQGIQYVREIDNALTELKKVTDETEETYNKFLQTASKTASKVGSTIKDVVSSTADWARIGYSLEQAAALAESTQIFLNVSEFTNVSDASSALISSLQAFNVEASNSMSIVDKFNEIGKVLPIDNYNG